VPETADKRLLCCGLQRTGKAMGQVILMSVENMPRNKCFVHVRISHILRFISICDIFSDPSSYEVPHCTSLLKSPVTWSLCSYVLVILIKFDFIYLISVVQILLQFLFLKISVVVMELEPLQQHDYSCKDYYCLLEYNIMQFGRYRHYDY
jgi:hypothetical protein